MHKKVILGLIFLLAVFGNIFVMSQCPTTSPASPHFGKNSTVYYNLSGFSDPKAAEAVEKAFKAWDTANQTNGSGVHFEASQNQSSPFSFQFGGSKGRIAAESIKRSNSITHIIISADFVYYTDGLTSSGTPIYDPGKPGYYDMIYEVTLHELGHTMGLQDIPNDLQQDRASVMNGFSGTNDENHHYATEITGCDNNAIRSKSSPYVTSGSGGGSSGDGNGHTGGPGNGDSGCTQTYMQSGYYENDKWYPMGDVMPWGCL